MTDNTMSIFEGGNSLVSADLFEQLKGINSNLMGGSVSNMRRISVRGSRFRQIVGGEQISVSSEPVMHIVIVNAAPLARTFYAGSYDPDKIVAPTCWSNDTNVPSDDVREENRQSDKCATCPQNVKGSGQGESRACRYSQRVAVVIEGQLDKVYQLQLAATSVFGDAESGKMPMGAYARYLSGHNTPSIAIVTAMYFDEDSDVPKLFFKPIRPLKEDELKQCIAVSQSDEALRAIEMTVAQVDNVTSPPEKKASSKKQEPKVLPEEESEVEEPKKKTSSKKPDPEPEEETDLSDIIAEWDD